jgi:hypothetical protein
MENLADINYLAVITAAIAAFALGALWYSPILFAKAWQKELGFTEADLQKGNMAITMGGSFVLMTLMSFGLALLLNTHPEGFDWVNGVYAGLFVGVFFVTASMGINMLYQNKTWRLFLIDAGYQIVFLSLMGLILGLWR